MRSRFMIGTGQFLFRYRSLIFPLIFISILFLFRPRVYTSESSYDTIITLGLVITLLGEGFRALTIGLDYIERGGKSGSPFASRLVTRGIYTQVRNPMYVGNLLIAFGISLYSGAPLVLVTILPFFVFVYYAIISAEESFLRSKFGDEFEEYCQRVNRLLPGFHDLGNAFRGFSFNWRRVLEKDNGTAFYTFLALVLVPIWRMYFLGDNIGIERYVPFAIAAVCVLIPSYAIVRFLAKTGRLQSA
jgi:protein-S-isoprenylcysteine O-methyltransferase Ste14